METQVMTEGVWLSAAELMARPMTGAAWTSVFNVAKAATVSGAKVSDQDNKHGRKTLAVGLAAARTGDAALRTKATSMLTGAIGTEAGARWLAIGRTLSGYIIAADVLGIRSGPIFDWLASFYTRTLRKNVSPYNQILLVDTAWNSGSNANAQEGLVHALLSVYLGNSAGLAWGWDGFRRYAGDRTSPHTMTSNSAAWQMIPSDPVGIQNKGAIKNGCNIDGAVSNDMSRGGDNLCNPVYTQYPWVGLNGAILAALVLSRQGYAAFDVSDQALKRAATYLYNLRQRTGDTRWYNTTRSDAKFIVNKKYSLTYPVRVPVGENGLTGWTDWTHG